MLYYFLLIHLKFLLYKKATPKKEKPLKFFKKFFITHFHYAENLMFIIWMCIIVKQIKKVDICIVFWYFLVVS